MLRIHAAKVYTASFTFQDLDLLVEGKKIKALLPPDLPFDKDCERIDAAGKLVIPGMIDIHIHGAESYDTMDADEEALATISRYLARRGVTAFLPTTMTTPIHELEAVFRLSPRLPGARMLGFNMEGPFINMEKRGAHLASQVREPSIAEFRHYLALGQVKLVTLAPEVPGAMAFIEEFHNDVVISLGHSNAGFEVASEAIGRGARSVTHCFNAMPPLLHRDPGILGAAARSGIFGEVICDGIHIHPAVIYCAYRLLGKERMILVSDSIRAAGLKDGEYELGGQPLTVIDGVARVPSGALGGSTSNIWAGLKHAVDFGLPLQDVIRMVSYNPARLIGEDSRKGSLAAGKDADFVVMDQALNIEQVYIEGQAFPLN